MKIRIIAVLALTLAAVLTVLVSAGGTPASAAALHQGKPYGAATPGPAAPYGCQLNSAACSTPGSTVITPPQQLPPTGGAAARPSANAGMTPLIVFATLFLLAGVILRSRRPRPVHAPQRVKLDE